MPTSQVSFAPLNEDNPNDGSRAENISRRPPQLALNRGPSYSSLDATRDERNQKTNMSLTDSTERSALLGPPKHKPTRKYTQSNPISPRSQRRSGLQSGTNSLILPGSSERNTSTWWDSPSPVFLRSGLRTPRRHRSFIPENSIIDDRAWYDQFTSTDWVHDSVADGYRVLELKKRKDFRGRLWLIFDAAQGWILVALIGCLTAAVAYMVDIIEFAAFDLKRGYCKRRWYLNHISCCKGAESCKNWRTWSEIIHPSHPDSILGDYLGFVLGCVIFAAIACLLTLRSKTVIPSNIASTFDENLGADKIRKCEHKPGSNLDHMCSARETPPSMTYYSAAGSGVAEVKVILSGFVLHGYLGFKTLLLKTPALIFSVASGMSLGKEGPYVHIATCIGNIACRIFPKYNLNDGKRREVLSAAAASGVAVAFGSPLGGVLFSLEEVSYYFPPKTLFRTFFCCIVAALSLKFLNPYGTNKIVPFEVRYDTGWQSFELFNFALLGVVGGIAGAAFIKASRFWAKTFRRWQPIKSNPLLEVLLVALVTGIVSFWNRYANLSVSELLAELARPCGPNNNTGLCPKDRSDIPNIIGYLLIAFAIKALLTTITFGIKVPAGIYVPSMVCGGLLGRIIGHTLQYAVLSAPESSSFGHCSSSSNLEQCITPGVYALVAAGATMCGVTRLSVTLAVIMFELTGSLDYVLPFAIGILTAKWVADFIEPDSIYDLLIEMNSYPFMDNKRIPVFEADTELGDITPRFRGERIIDISISPYVKASELRLKLQFLHNAGELDGGLPIICEKALVGLIPAPDLEFALDGIDGPEENTLCLMSNVDKLAQATGQKRWHHSADNLYEYEDAVRSSRSSIASSDHLTEEDDAQSTSETNFVPYIDHAPVTLEVRSPMNLVFQCFSKLGLRYICVVEAGEYRGMVHKKAFVKYLKTHEGKFG